MRGFKFNFITIFAFVLLVVYAYLAAMGLLYQEGKISVAGIYSIAIIATVSICIYLMCHARATRWEKVGIPAQVALGLVIVATFFFIGKPFSSYVTMMGKKKEVYKEISAVVAAAQELNTAYNLYADKRIEAYQPIENKTNRRDLRKNALKLQLLPPNLVIKQTERDQWLNGFANMRLSNIQMPNNLKNMEECVALWLEDYTQISSVVFNDEYDVSTFEYDKFTTQLASLRSHLGGYSLWALLVAALCSIFMLIPYFTTKTSFALREGNNEGFGMKIKKKFIVSDSDNNKSDEELDYM